MSGLDSTKSVRVSRQNAGIRRLGHRVSSGLESRVAPLILDDSDIGSGALRCQRNVGRIIVVIIVVIRL